MKRLVIALIALAALAATTDVAAEPSGDLAPPQPAFQPGVWAPRVLAQAGAQAVDAEEDEGDYDPWESFNTKMFEFNRQVDRHALKPAAQGWDKATPVTFRQSLQNAVKNIGMPRRFVNSVLQGKFHGALRELTRFIMNSSVGIGGLFDVATPEGIPASEEDLGQTLGVYGIGPGPYLVLPFLPPLTVRDGVGFVGDLFLDPLNYVLPLGGRLGFFVGNAINDRSLNLQLFEQVEADVFDLYSAVRNAYLQRRQREIER